jgi:hypothetical protein
MGMKHGGGGGAGAQEFGRVEKSDRKGMNDSSRGVCVYRATLQVVGRGTGEWTEWHTL